MDSPGGPVVSGRKLDPLLLLESGLATEKNASKALVYLDQGQYPKALDALTGEDKRRYSWLEGYLEGLVEVSAPLVRYESKSFDLYLPPDQTFLKDYVIPNLEQAISHINKEFRHKRTGKIRVEIYPTKETFSAASTLSMETLKRSGAIGICKFHRLMILSPRGLPLGYRWLDALAHEYTHLVINEVSWSQAELWLHEGTARYFDTSYRADPPEFLSPNQKTKLLEALEEETWVTFKRMSPSLVYLKDQAEVSLAFAQVAYAVANLIQEKGQSNFVRFLKNLRKEPFRDSFDKRYQMTPEEFEGKLQSQLGQETWVKTKGAMSDEVLFDGSEDDLIIGAALKAQVRMGDRMRQKRYFQAALVQYNKALKEEPDNAIVLLKAARTHQALGDTESALKNLKRAVQSNPNYGTPHIDLAELVQPEEAVPYLLTAIAINPFDPRIHRLLAKAYGALGRTEESEREIEIYQQLTGQ